MFEVVVFRSKNKGKKFNVHSTLLYHLCCWFGGRKKIQCTFSLFESSMLMCLVGEKISMCIQPYCIIYVAGLVGGKKFNVHSALLYHLC